MLLIPVAIASSASAVFITTVNSFMNQPQGFTLKNGVMTNIHPIEAMLNPATPTKVSHVLASSYTLSAGVLMGLAAYSMLRGRNHPYFKKALKLTATCTIVFAISTVMIGDASGKFLAKYQPEKLAAAEWHFDTMTHAPFVYGGFMDENGEIKYALKVPYALSVLAGNLPSTEVKGLNDYPVEERPPLSIHYMFDLKITTGVLILVIPLLYLIRKRLPGRKPYPRWLLLALILVGPMAMVAIELGWMFAEVGRQPWILRGYMKVSEAATTSTSVGWMLVLFVILYLVLCFSAIKVLSKLFRNKDAVEEIRQLGLEGAEGK